MLARGAALLSIALAATIGCGCSVHNDLSFEQALADCRPASTAPVEPGSAEPAQAKRPLTWLELGRYADLSVGADEPLATGKVSEYEPWSTRRGPAYKGDFWHSVGRDAKELPQTMWDDTKATFTDPPTLVALGVSGIAGIVLNASGSDNRVQDHFEKHGSGLNTFWDTVGDVGGNPGTHFGVAGAMYIASLAAEDQRNYEVSKALINALAINGLLNVGLKGIVRTDSPNGDPFGWPSGHTSSTFCLATVMHEAYGPWVGAPLFAFASFVGYERIDARNHDFSDVISGAIMGIAIGHVVMQNHQPKLLGFDVIPWSDPVKGAVGVALSRQF